jgi:hypothetical protein
MRTEIHRLSTPIGMSIIIFIPFVIVVSAMRAWLLPYSNSEKGVFEFIVNHGGVLLVIPIWIGMSIRKVSISRGEQLSFWAVVVCSFFIIAALLTVIYDFCFVASILVLKSGFHALSGIPGFLSAWWPDSSSGVIYIMMSIIVRELLTFASLLLALTYFFFRRKNDISS